MKTLVIANPTSGGFNRELLDKCVQKLGNKFGKISVEYTKEPREAAYIAANCDAGMVVAAGGDGLINEVAGGMVYKDKIFTALPFGTVNVFCREHKIPLNPVKAVDKLNIDDLKKLSVGFLDERPFLLMCGFGYDAKVVEGVIGKPKILNKTVNHLQSGIKALSAPYPKLNVYTNNKQYPAYHVIISLAQCYAGNFRLSKHIKRDKLNVFIQNNNRPNSILFSVLSIMTGGGFPNAPIYADELKISGTKYAQIDGEFVDMGTTHNYIKIKKDLITVAL